jgi:hypothetical protein
LLLFIVARTRLDRFEELRQYFAGWRDVRIVLDRREGERREPHDTCVGVERRRAERRHRLEPSLKKLGWAVVDTNELVS